MRRRDREIVDRSEIEDIIRRAKVCRIALCDGGQPYIVPVCFGNDRDRLYIHSAPAGRKLDIIRRHPRVCFEMEIDVELVPADAACGWGIRYRSVVGFGRASLVEDDEEKLRALRLLMRQYSEEEFDLGLDSSRDCAVVRIDIESLTGKRCAG